MKKFVSALLTCASQLMSNAYADEMTVFGIPFAQNFSLPECKKGLPGRKAGLDVGATKVVCYYRWKGMDPGPPVNTVTSIYFPRDDAPDISKNGMVGATIIDGRLEGIGFYTRGVDDANAVLTKLTEKYGAPTTKVPHVVPSSIGASYTVFDATWIKPNIEVRFQSMYGASDTGHVSIRTPKAIERDNRLREEHAKDRLPL